MTLLAASPGPFADVRSARFSLAVAHLLLVASCFVDSASEPSTQSDGAVTSEDGTSTSAADDESSSTSSDTTSASETDRGDVTTGETPEDAWSRHTFDLRQQSWSSLALDELWTQSNAPPPGNIAAAVSLTHFDRLLVLTSDSILHERVDGTWITPVPVAERFAETAGLSISGMAHTPQAGGMVDIVTFIDNPTAVFYAMHEDGSVVHDMTMTMTDDTGGGAPQGTGRARWYFEIVDPTQINTDPDWLQWFIAFDDGRLYRFNVGPFEWSSWSITDNPFFGVAAGQPNPNLIHAAYTDHDSSRVHFIGP
jgi:hypothetical protein